MMPRASATVVLMLATALSASPMARTQPPAEAITDPDAYAIYALVLPPLWATEGKGPILLQQETTISMAGDPTIPVEDTDWQAARDSFWRENTRAGVLQPLFPVDIMYRLIPKATIDADDQRLALKYPGIWMRLPESMEYAAVSIVGFNPSRDKAILYARLRGRGGLHYLEKRDGAWVRAKLPFAVVGWIA
jgi:hypothetical protein